MTEADRLTEKQKRRLVELALEIVELAAAAPYGIVPKSEFLARFAGLSPPEHNYFTELLVILADVLEDAAHAGSPP